MDKTNTQSMGVTGSYLKTQNAKSQMQIDKERTQKIQSSKSLRA